VSVATYAAARILRLLPRTGLSHAVGRLCERPIPPGLSRAVTDLYIRAYRVDMADVAEEPRAYESFDAFFTRPLRDGARAIANAPLVSPADGKLVAAGPIDPGLGIVVKQQTYGVAELIGDAAEAERLAGGSFSVVYLSPRDYHRVHSPVDGALCRVRGIAGDLYPVNSIGEQHVPGLFVKNQRVALSIDTPNLGRVVLVMVGAMIVGRISVRGFDERTTPLGERRLSPPAPLSRGDEVGRFHLGSTTVLLTGPEAPRHTRAFGPVRYGEPLTA
jgi:phosphatidylserine decarboxylase